MYAAVQEELVGIVGLVEVLTSCTSADNVVTDELAFGAYRLGSHIHDQLDSVQELLSMLHSVVLDASFDA